MKKVALFVIFVLIFGTISPSLVNHAYAQNDPSILLRIAIQADKQIVNQLDRVYGNQIPDDIQTLYHDGHTAVKLLDESLSNDLKKAKENFLVAMNSFMQISRVISQSTDKTVVITVYQKSNRDLSSEIDRLEKYVKTLESISKKYNTDVESDFIKIHNLIQKLRNSINDENGEYDKIKNELKFLLNSIKNNIQESALKHRIDFVKQFFDKLLNKIDEKLIQAEDDNIDQSQIDKGHELVFKVKEFLSKNQIQNAKKSYSELKELMYNIGYLIEIKIT